MHRQCMHARKKSLVMSNGSIVDMALTAQQQRVIDKVDEFMKGDASVFILCGYAGTGKTTMVKHIADHVSRFRTVALMAPTGRAARVLSEKTGYAATTIHKAIYSGAALQTTEAEDMANAKYRLCFPISNTSEMVVAIVDEASMLCSRKKEQELFVFGTDNLMDDLLTYVRPASGGKVIFVGDPMQLPPVGETVSNALSADFFAGKGLKVMTAELTEVLRQTGGSVILNNAMQIRDLLKQEKRNRMVFEERQGEVESLPSGLLIDRYMEARSEAPGNDSVIICYSNRSACEYNKEVRRRLYGEDQPALRAGDVLMVVQNNYLLERMNGEFVTVRHVGETVRQSAPVYVQEGGVKVRKVIEMEFAYIQVPNPHDGTQGCMLLLDLLNDGRPSLGIDEQRALFINFRMRNPNLRPGAPGFADALRQDPYFNCLQAKYGYAVTGHKCQGGEWACAFVDYSGRTGLSDECLRWAYTATTRARRYLGFANLSHITPFARFRIEPIRQCSKISEECRVFGSVDSSPFHDANAPVYLHAKWMCIDANLKLTPYSIDRVESRPYQEIYYITTPDGIERYDIRYKKGGIFLKAVPQSATAHSVMVGMLLDDENAMPLYFGYEPSDDTHEQLYSLVRSACDGLGIAMTNVVEHSEDYSVAFYFRTSCSHSYIKIYVNGSGFVTYAMPMSLMGAADSELAALIEEIKLHFE